MNVSTLTSPTAFFTLFLAAVLFFIASPAHAKPSYFTSRCASCHAAPVVATCNGCHQHGGKNLGAVTDKPSYAAGETVTVTLSGGSKSGWIRAALYDENDNLLAESTGNDSGMGGSTFFPAILSAPAPLTAGSHTWTMAYFGNDGSGARGHAEKPVTMAPFTVIAPPDELAPTVDAFSLPAESTGINVPVNTFTATDNVAVAGYLITASPIPPAAGAVGWSLSAPAVVTAPGAGTVTFYAWAKDAAGNVSAAATAVVSVSVPEGSDITPPELTLSTLGDGAVTANPLLNVSGLATDDVALGEVKVNQVSVPVAADGSFTTAVLLNTGANQISVVVSDAAGNPVTRVRSITYQADAGKLFLTTPVDQQVTSQGLLPVKGSSDKFSVVDVTVEGQNPQVAERKGKTFEESVLLEPGLNTLLVTSELNGRLSTAKRTVYYSADRPALSIITPAEDHLTAKRSLTIKGEVADSSGEATVTVEVNGQSYTPKVKKGKFTQKISLTTPQLYTIVVTARGGDGSQSVSRRNVLYRP